MNVQVSISPRDTVTNQQSLTLKTKGPTWNLRELSYLRTAINVGLICWDPEGFRSFPNYEVKTWTPRIELEDILDSESFPKRRFRLIAITARNTLLTLI